MMDEARRFGYVQWHITRSGSPSLFRRLVLAAAATISLAGATAARAQDAVTIFAAASLTDAMRALGQEWVARGHPAPRISLAASSALARQIEQGAPADLFASADEAWMDYLQQRNLIVNDTRSSPIGNSLVLIAPADAARPVSLTRGTDLRARLDPHGRIATGDPAHVPVGRYARAALTWMGQWDAIAPRLARADNVRAALLLVERGEAPYGIVYGTDAAIAPGVRVVGTFPVGSHTPITYPFALTRRAEGNAEARALLAFLTGPEARPAWQRFGFSIPQ
jgi:molybdate transport system substrate-binding protein